MMIKKVLKEIENIDTKVMKIINYGFLISFTIGIIGIIMLRSYSTYNLGYDIYKGGLLLVRAGVTFAAQSFACGFLFDKIKKG